MMNNYNVTDYERTVDIAIDLYNTEVIDDYEVRNRGTNCEDVRIFRHDGATMSIALHKGAAEEGNLDLTWCVIDNDEDSDAEYILDEDGAPLEEGIAKIVAWCTCT